MAETQVTIRFDRELYRDFKAECMRRDTTPTEEFQAFVARRLEGWLAAPQVTKPPYSAKEL